VSDMNEAELASSHDDLDSRLVPPASVVPLVLVPNLEGGDQEPSSEEVSSVAVMPPPVSVDQPEPNEGMEQNMSPPMLELKLVPAKTKAEESSDLFQNGDQAVSVEMAPESEGGECAENDFDDGDDTLLPEAQPSFPRNEVNQKAPAFRQDAVHVYGLDFLETNHMIEIFSQFNHKYIEWVNKSSANVVFRDAVNAKKALESLSYPKDGDEPWRRTPDILVSEGLPAVFLQMRFALPSDVKPPKRSVSAVTPTRSVSSTATWPGSEDARNEKRKWGTEVEVPEEELVKRRKRAERFGLPVVAPEVPITVGEAP